MDAAGGLTAAVTSVCQRLVGVPPSVLAVVSAPVDREDLREAFDRIVFVWMRISHVTEALRERDLLRVAELLSAKEHDLPFEKCGSDVGDRLIPDRPRQIDAPDLGARMPR